MPERKKQPHRHKYVVENSAEVIHLEI